MVRHYVFRGVKCDEAEPVDTRGVCNRHNQAEEQGMDGLSLRPYQVGGHDRFSVSGLQRVQTAQRSGEQRRRQHKPKSPLIRGNEFSEAVVRCSLFIGFQGQFLR